MSAMNSVGAPNTDQPDDIGRIDLSEAKSFGAAILTLRSRLGRSQARIALDAKVGAGYYSDVENDRRMPRRATALRIAAALGVSPEQAEALAALVNVDRNAAQWDPTLRPDARALVRAIVLAAPRLTPSAISRLAQTLQKCRE